MSAPIARPLARAQAVLDRDRLAVADCMKIRFCGAELVTDRATREPAAITTTDVEEMLATFDHALSDVEAGRFDDGKLSGYAGW